MTQLRKPVELVSEGQVIIGVVVNAAPFGLFIEIVPGKLDGLLRFEHTPYAEIARPMRVGQRVEVIVKGIDVQREAVYLELLADPTLYDETWAERSTDRTK